MKEDQISPRINIIWEESSYTVFHAGYARYFTPPPLEIVNSPTLALFNGTANQSEVTQNSPVKAERADYYDAGISQKIIKELSIGVDGYYKSSVNQLDDGLFGQSFIPSSYGYALGKVMGVEFTSSFSKDNFSAYANVTAAKDQGTDINSAQFLFSQSDLNYISNHWISLDHEQSLSGSIGASYSIKEVAGETLIYADAIYGSGLRKNGVDANGNAIPNGDHVPAYYVINIGAGQSIKIGLKNAVKFRLDIVNLLDRIYLIRDNTGIGVNAAQYGQRRGIYGQASLVF